MIQGVHYKTKTQQKNHLKIITSAETTEDDKTATLSYLRFLLLPETC